jgi:hypothetical protein
MENEKWGELNLSEDVCISWVSPETTLSIKKEGNELLVGKTPTAQDHDPDEDPEKKPVFCNDDLQWFRFLLGKEETVELSPLLPDRAVVVKPFVGRVLPPGRRGEFSFTLPLWAGLYAGKEHKRSLLMEFPTSALTTTWFGDMQSGELCYGRSTELVTISDGRAKGDPDPFTAEVRLFLRNASQSMLDFSKICIHAEHLTLYRNREKAADFRTNEIFVLFSGADQVSQVRFGKKVPRDSSAEETVLDKVAAPRLEPGKGFLKRSFSFLKYLTDM